MTNHFINTCLPWHFNIVAASRNIDYRFIPILKTYKEPANIQRYATKIEKRLFFGFCKRSFNMDVIRKRRTQEKMYYGLTMETEVSVCIKSVCDFTTVPTDVGICALLL